MSDNLDYISFAEWLVDLNICAVRAGYKTPHLVKVTGQFCWYPYYEQGMSPSTALEIAANTGKVLGDDYCNEL